MSPSADDFRPSAASLGAAYCEACGTALAADQRWCLECGRRQGPRELGPAMDAEPPAPVVVAMGPAAMPAASPEEVPLRRTTARAESWIRGNVGYLPDPRTSAAYVLIFLGAGVLIGSNAANAPGANPLERAVINIVTGGSEEEEQSADTSAAGEDAAETAPALAAGGGAAGAAPAPSSSAPLAAPLGAPSAGLGVTPGPTTSSVKPPADSPPAVSAGPEESFAGTVVHVNPGAESYTVATPRDKLLAIHTRRLPKVGEEVKVGADSLFNGTLVERTVREAGERPKAEFDGTVTFVDAERRLYTLSERGVSLLVHVPEKDPEAEDKGNADTIPRLGDRVKVGVRFEDPPNGERPQAEPHPKGEKRPKVKPQPLLRQTRLVVAKNEPAKSDGPDAKGEGPEDVYVNGTVAKLDKKARELTISADDQRRSERDIVLNVPENIDFPDTFRKKDAVIARVTIEKDGTYTLEGAAEDGSRKDADDTDGLFGTLEGAGEGDVGGGGSGEI